MRVRRGMHRDPVEHHRRDAAFEENEVVGRYRYYQAPVWAAADSMAPGDRACVSRNPGGAGVVERDPRRCRRYSTNHKEKKQGAQRSPDEWAK
jgi:hypothetical protein